jgi:hypothetical protein
VVVGFGSCAAAGGRIWMLCCLVVGIGCYWLWMNDITSQYSGFGYCAAIVLSDSLLLLVNDHKKSTSLLLLLPTMISQALLSGKFLS